MEMVVQDTGATLAVSERCFGRSMNESLVHQAVVSYLANGRAGSKAQKSRAEVSGGGAKPWRQKGTGRARSGTSRSPIWRGGGVTFAAKPRSHSVKMNKKMFRAALATILSELYQQDRLRVVEALSVAEPKTRLATQLLAPYKTSRTLIVLDRDDSAMMLAARNIPWVHVVTAGHVDPVSLVGAEQVVATVAAVKQLEERFQ